MKLAKTDTNVRKPVIFRFDNNSKESINKSNKVIKEKLSKIQASILMEITQSKLRNLSCELLID